MKKHTPITPKQLLIIAAMLLILGVLTVLLFTYRQDEKRFTNITTQIFTAEMTSNTLNMHYTLAFPEEYGIYDYQSVLPGYSAEGRKNGQVSTENALAALSAIHTENLSSKDAYLWKLLTRSLESSMALSNFALYQEPLSPYSGMQTQLPILLAEYTFRSKRDVEDYLSLLDQVDEYFSSMIIYEQEKAKVGLGMPAFCLREVRKQCDIIVTKEELQEGTHFLQTTFRERLQELYDQGDVTLEEAKKFLVQNDRLLKTVLFPAYVSLGDGLLLLEDESVPLTGLAARPEGKAYYEALLVSETGSYRSAEQIQEMLTLRFSLVYDKLQTLITEHPDLVGSYTDSTSISFPYTEASVMLVDLQQRMSQDFPVIPGDDVDTTVKSVSESLADYCAPAFYLTTPLDDTNHNVIYINNRKTPHGLELYTTLAHEGYPGHMYQTVYNNRSIVTDGEQPLRDLLWYGGYLEGWALYAEFISFDYASELLKEQGLDQESLLAQIEKYNRELQLCLYSMLDIMIHHENASYNKIASVLQNFGITDEDSILSIYSYIALEPCNYLKYYLGYLEILSLREAAKELWGTEYTDYKFHCFFLETGPSDFTSLAEQLEIYELPAAGQNISLKENYHLRG